MGRTAIYTPEEAYERHKQRVITYEKQRKEQDPEFWLRKKANNRKNYHLRAERIKQDRAKLAQLQQKMNNILNINTD